MARGGKKLDKFDIPDEATAHAYRDALRGQPFRVESIEAKEHKRNPAPPFTTSSLQQEASRKLGLSPRQTMQIAQHLYEGIDIGGETVGLITYMRTDGVQIVPEAIAQARGQIESQFGKRYVPNAPRVYKTKAKNAQEAHEAIRPTDFHRQPDKLKGLSAEEARLYKLIWQRAVASQMASADFERTTVEITAQGRDGQPYGVRATGSVVMFDGFLKLYEEGHDDAEDEEGGRLPKLKQGEQLRDAGVKATQHFTEPPPRYTEATLIREMERLGIGRPSTYASTMGLLREREYVKLEKKRLEPEDKGRLVTSFLEAFFKRYVEYDFTAYLEDRLDLISDGKLDWKELLREFWRDFIAAVNDIKDLRVTQVLDALNELLGPHIFPARADGGDARLCPLCNQGQLSLKVGKFGAFVGCSNYPECRYTRQLKTGDARKRRSRRDAQRPGAWSRPGNGPGGLPQERAFRPLYPARRRRRRRKAEARIYPAWQSSRPSIELEYALKLLALPRQVGLHPETQKPIMAGFGRYGPYVEHDGKYLKIDADEVLAIGSEPRGRRHRGRSGARQGRRGADLHSDQGAGRTSRAWRKDGSAFRVAIGPYIKYGKVNATIPKGKAPESVTMEEAVALIKARMESGGSKGKGRAARPKPRSRKPPMATAKRKPKRPKLRLRKPRAPKLRRLMRARPRNRKRRPRRRLQNRRARRPSQCRPRKTVWTSKTKRAEAGAPENTNKRRYSSIHSIVPSQYRPPRDCQSLRFQGLGANRPEAHAQGIGRRWPDRRRAARREEGCVAKSRGYCGSRAGPQRRPDRRASSLE